MTATLLAVCLFWLGAMPANAQSGPGVIEAIGGVPIDRGDAIRVLGDFQEFGGGVSVFEIVTDALVFRGYRVGQSGSIQLSYSVSDAIIDVGAPAPGFADLPSISPGPTDAPGTATLAPSAVDPVLLLNQVAGVGQATLAPRGTGAPVASTAESLSILVYAADGRPIWQGFASYPVLSLREREAVLEGLVGTLLDNLGRTVARQNFSLTY